jgi:hypothetical protein
MSQTAFGLLTMGFMFVTMGGVGLYAAWPDLKKYWHSFKNKNDH